MYRLFLKLKEIENLTDNGKKPVIKKNGFKKLIYTAGIVISVLMLIALFLPIIEGVFVHKKQTDNIKHESAAVKKVNHYPPVLPPVPQGNNNKNDSIKVNGSVNDKNDSIKVNGSVKKIVNNVGIVNDINKTDTNKMKNNKNPAGILSENNSTNTTHALTGLRAEKSVYVCENLLHIKNETVYFIKQNNKFIPVYTDPEWDGKGIVFLPFETKQVLKKEGEYYEVEKGKYLINSKFIKCFQIQAGDKK